MKVVIIGGVAGGATAAARLRRLDERAEIIILERTGYVSYANCGLPYYVGGVITDREELTLQTPEGFRNRFGIDVRVGQEAVELHPEQHTAIDHFHSEVCKNVCDCSAAAGIDLAHLCQLECNLIFIKYMSQFCNVLCIGIIRSTFSSGSRMLIEHHTFSKERIRSLVINIRMHRIKCSSHIR